LLAGDKYTALEDGPEYEGMKREEVAGFLVIPALVDAAMAWTRVPDYRTEERSEASSHWQVLLHVDRERSSAGLAILARM